MEVEVRAQKQESSIDFKQAFESRETSDTLMRISRFWRKDPQGLICTRHSFRHCGGGESSEHKSCPPDLPF